MSISSREEDESGKVSRNIWGKLEISSVKKREMEGAKGLDLNPWRVSKKTCRDTDGPNMYQKCIRNMYHLCIGLIPEFCMRPTVKYKGRPQNSFNVLERRVTTQWI